jgi:hypothetical protein
MRYRDRLESALSEGWGLKGLLKEREIEIGLESALSEKRGRESALWMKIEIRLGSALIGM